MALFSRRARHGSPKERPVKQRRTHEPYTMSKRPTFGAWLKYTWLDILTMAAMGALGLGVRLPFRGGVD